MYNNNKILALVPARGGSKGVPRKNIRMFYGKPLIAWTIQQAKNSRYIDRIIVSTDDRKIAEISKKYGAEVPFMRPKELASDNSRAMGYILHALNYLEKSGLIYKAMVLLQPTSPLRTPEDIDNAIRLLFKKKADAIVSVCETQNHPYFANTLPADGCMKSFVKQKHINKNRQGFGKFYRLNGAIYLALWGYIRKQKNFFGRKTFAYIMPQIRSLDIDTEIDFKLGEILKKEMVR